MSEAWEKPLGPDRDWWQRYEVGVGTVTVAWRTVNGIEGWYLSNATGAVHVLLDGQTKPKRNPAPLATADAVLKALADARYERDAKAGKRARVVVGEDFHLHRASIWHGHEGGTERHGHGTAPRWWEIKAETLLGDPDGWAPGPSTNTPETPSADAVSFDPQGWRRIRFVVPADRSVPPVGTPVSVPVDADWLELGVIAAGRVVDGGVELTLELHEDLAAAGGADTNESVA